MTRTTLYHRTDPPRIVDTPEQRDALLADGWAETPAAFYDAPEPPADATSAPRRTRTKK